jgi:hypothetical protein
MTKMRGGGITHFVRNYRRRGQLSVTVCDRDGEEVKNGQMRTLLIGPRLC